MITLTLATVEGDSGWTLAQLDGATVEISRALGGPGDAWNGAEFLRDVYGEVLRTAGSVTLVAPAAGAAVAA